MSVQFPHSVELSSRAAEGISSIFRFEDVGRINTAERMAWVVCVLRELKDSEVVFPRGKWATIQEAEAQIRAAARFAAEEIAAEMAVEP